MKPHLPNILYAALLAAVSAVCFTLPQSWAAPVVITLGEINTNAAHDFVTDDFVLNAVGDTTYDLSDGSTLAMTLSGGKFWGTHNNGDGVLTGTWTNTAALAEWNSIINGSFTAADLSAGDNYCYTASGNGGSTSTATLSLDSSLYTAGSSIITIYVTATAKSGSLNDFTVSGLDDCVLSYATNNGNGFVDTPAYSNGASAITLIKATGTLNGSDIAMHSSTGKNGWQSISYAISTPIPLPIPPDYTAVYITQTEQLSSYTTADYKAFVIGSNINNNSYKIGGGHQYWADATINTHVLTFSGLPNGALEANTELVVHNFKEVNFINSTIVSAGVLSLTDNESITFCDNSNYYKSAIYAPGSIHLANNKRVAFTNNNAGAICAFGDVSIENNEKVEFSRNHPDTSNFDSNGALYGYSINISNNDSVVFRENDSASWKSGAIVTASMSLTGNGHVEFRGNSVAYSTGMRFLRCIDLRGSEQLNLAAGEGQDITFYDSIYAQTYRYMDEHEDLKVSYNADYTDRDGEIRKATGDIVFSGKYAKQDLAELKADYTPEELAASLTTEVLYATTNLYGGRLRIEDGAIYKGDGISVAADSHATLRLANGTLDQAGYNVTLASGTTLDLQGVNKVIADKLDMQDGSTLSITLNRQMQTDAALTLSGEFQQRGELTIEISTTETLVSRQRYRLVDMVSEASPISWDDSHITLIGPGISLNELYWEDGILYYTGSNFPLLTWSGEQSRVWNSVDANWKQSDSVISYNDASDVLFGDTGSGDIVLEGALAPESVLVENTAGHDYTFTGSGRLVGGMLLTKDGAGSLTVNNANSYTGGTLVKAGAVALGNVQALGQGAVELQGGTLNMSGLSVGNELVVTGAATVNNANRYLGRLVLDGGQLNGSTLQLAQDATVLSGSIANNLTGKGGILKTGGGTVELSGLNSYSGTTSIEEGILKVSGMVTGNIAVNGGTLDTANGMTLSYGQSVTLNGGNVDGNLSTREGSALVVQTGATLDGDLALNGGLITFANAGPDNRMTITGALNIQSGTRMNLTGYDEAGSYYLASFGSMSGSLGDISLSAAFPEGGRQQAMLTDAGSYLVLTVTGDAATLNWSGGSGTWSTGTGTKWTSPYVTDTKFYTNDTVVFARGGTVTISGEVAPKAVSVSGTTATVFKGTGSIVGETSVVKDGTGTLTMNASNAYTGGTVINDGTVNASGADSFGLNSIQLNGGTLNLKTYAVENDITANGGTISGSAYNGALTVLGDVTVSGILTANSIDLKSGSLNGGTITDAMVYAHAGSIGSDITGESELDIDGDVVFTGTAGHTLGTYVNSGTFTLEGIIGGDIVLMGGTLKTEDLQLGEWQLLEFSGGSVQGNVTAGENSMLNLYADSTIDGDLVLDGALVELNDSSLEVTGRLTVENGSFDAQGGIHAHEVQLGADAAMDVRDGNGETVYSVKSASGKQALTQGVTFTAESITGSGEAPARIDNAIVKLEENSRVEVNNVILGAGSRLTDDPATVVANNMVIEGQYGVNVQEGEPMTIKSGSIMQRLGQPSELIELDSDATACRLDITNVDSVSITGNCLTIDLSGMYPALYEYSQKFDWLGISLGSGDQVAALDTNMVVELKLNDRLHPRAYYNSGVGWGGTDFVMPVANGENVGMIYVCMFDVPEPATSTLSLLALAALAVRRRRK